MQSIKDTKAVLFVDIADSSSFYDSLGDQLAKTLMTDAMSMLSDIVMQYNGDVIKTIGDSIMATFDDAQAAAEAALFMQKIFQANQISDLVQAGEVILRIGLNFGEMVVDSDDVFGNAVIIASRLADQAKPKQILTSKETRNLLPEALITVSRFILKKQLKGVPHDVEIYELLDAEDDANVTTIASDDISAIALGECDLNLVYMGQTHHMNHEKVHVRIGRSDENDIVINNANTSRLHATIELKAGKFLLTDKSVNGTYVFFDDGNMQKIHMDSMTLYQKGRILLGSRDDEENAITFSHE